MNKKHRIVKLCVNISHQMLSIQYFKKRLFGYDDFSSSSGKIQNYFHKDAETTQEKTIVIQKTNR